jgi:hypothetical protein
MHANRAALAIVVAIVLLAGVWLFYQRSTGAPPVQLVPLFGSAEKRPQDDAWGVMDAQLNGETRQAITAPAASRLIYKVRIPDDGWLRVAVGTKPESWTQEGNGVLFFVGVSDGRTYEDLFTQHVNPYANAGDRKWIQVWVDLSAYAGEDVELIFNTRPSPPDQAEDARNDLPLWGEPEIVVR